MKRFKVIALRRGCAHGMDLGMTVEQLGKSWVGTAGEPDRRYLFWENPFFAEFKVPAEIAIADAIHIGIKGDRFEDRLKWIVEDFDEQYLLLRKWSDRDVSK